MKNPDYTAFDAELLRLIAAGKNRMMLLDSPKVNGLLFELAKPHCVRPEKYPEVEWHIIYRRLQALRKKGEIRHNGKVWEIIKKGDA